MVLLQPSSFQLFQHESGLFATTLMGVILANQKQVDVRHVLEFMKNLVVLMISTLFIVSQPVSSWPPSRPFSVGHVGLLLGLLVIVRLLTVWVSAALH